MSLTDSPGLGTRSQIRAFRFRLRLRLRRDKSLHFRRISVMSPTLRTFASPRRWVGGLGGGRSVRRSLDPLSNGSQHLKHPFASSCETVDAQGPPKPPKKLIVKIVTCNRLGEASDPSSVLTTLRRDKSSSQVGLRRDKPSRQVVLATSVQNRPGTRPGRLVTAV